MSTLWSANSVMQLLDSSIISVMNEIAGDIYDDTSDFEKFLLERINKDAQIYIYQKDHPFLTKERLDETFGDIFFFQVRSLNSFKSKNSFNIHLYNNKYHVYSEDSIKELVEKYEQPNPENQYDYSKIMRFGYLKCFYSEKFDPFQETMTRLLNTDVVKYWMKKESSDALSAYFINGELITFL